LVAWVRPYDCAVFFTKPDRTWATFQFPVDLAAKVFFDASIIVEVQDGAQAFFSEDLSRSL
jgi:hypothetical protein